MTHVKVIFDGGTRKGNPGKGYGSYIITGPKLHEHEKKWFGPMTNNRAELRTMIAALWRTHDFFHMRDSLGPIGDASIEIWGDSQIAINGVSGKYTLKDENAALVQEARDILSKFASYALHWHPRSESVRILGH